MKNDPTKKIGHKLGAIRADAAPALRGKRVGHPKTQQNEEPNTIQFSLHDFQKKRAKQPSRRSFYVCIATFSVVVAFGWLREEEIFEPFSRDF